MADEVIGGRYLLEERLGAGGMSEVWRAVDQELERTVAVKLLRPDADRARFEREARADAGDRGRHRLRPRARACTRARPPRPEAGERPVRRRGAREDRRLRDRAA